MDSKYCSVNNWKNLQVQKSGALVKSCKVGNIVSFSGTNHLLTTQFKRNIQIDGTMYQSVDHFYQKMKVADLTGLFYGSFDQPTVENFRGLARKLLASHRVKSLAVNRWRMSRGVEVLQKALLAQYNQDPSIRTYLLSTGDALLCHTYAADNFFGTGCNDKKINEWAADMIKRGCTLKLPMSFPMDEKELQNLPIVGNGVNILGVLYMAIREKFKMESENTVVMADEHSSHISNLVPNIVAFDYLNIPAPEHVSVYQPESLEYDYLNIPSPRYSPQPVPSPYDYQPESLEYDYLNIPSPRYSPQPVPSPYEYSNIKKC